VKENYLTESFVGFWALIGMSAAVNLRVLRDYGLVAAGALEKKFNQREISAAIEDLCLPKA
jgi:hypothetical protein